MGFVPLMTAILGFIIGIGKRPRLCIGHRAMELGLVPDTGLILGTGNPPRSYTGHMTVKLGLISGPRRSQ